jgi:hypothetical protein
MNIYEGDMGKNALLRHVGAMKQIMGAREVTYRGGRQEGVKAVEVYNDTGLSFTVLPDKGMDIGAASFCGKPLAWLCKNGIVGPQYFENGGAGFFRSFSGGLLSTCGLTNVGEGGFDGEMELGVHDRIGNLPAERVQVEEYWADDDYYVDIKGTVRQSCLYHENLTLTREISLKLGEPKIRVTDMVENEGYSDTPLMMMYHMNFGYPVLSPHTRLYSQARRSWLLAGEETGVGYSEFLPPTKDYAYQCIAHDMPDSDRVSVALVNNQLDLGIYVEYAPAQLPYFDVWKMTGEQDYVVGLEPGLSLPEGRKSARENGRLVTIHPEEVYIAVLEIGVLAGREQIEEHLQRYQETK